MSKRRPNVQKSAAAPAIPSTFPPRQRLLFWAIVVSAAGLYSYLNPLFRTGIFNDDAVYVIVAKDLANRNASQLLPSIQPDYPLPGLPLVLAPLAKLAAPHWVRLESVTVAVTVISLVVLALWLLRWVSPQETLLIVALFAFNPTVVKYSGIIMPSPYYTLGLIACLLLMSLMAEHPTVGRALALGTLLGWACVIRAEGGVLLICIFAGLWKPLRDKRFLAIVAVPVLFWGAFIVYWFTCRHLNQSNYAGDVRALISYWSSDFMSGLPFSWTFLRLLFLHTLLRINVASDALTTGILLLAIGGMAAGLRRLWQTHKTRHAELVSVILFCGLYGMAHSFWHVALPRYCITLIPFAWLFVLRGLPSSLRMEPGRSWRAIALAVPLFAVYAYKNGKAVVACAKASNTMNAPPWHTLNWITQNTPNSIKILSTFSPSIVLYSHRPTASMFDAGDAETFRYGLHKQGIDYVVDQPIAFVTPGVGGTENLNVTWGKVRRWMAAYPQWFHTEFQDGLEKTSVVRVIHSEEFVQAFDGYYAAFDDFRNGRRDESLLKVNESLQLDQDLGSAHTLRGVIYFYRKDYVKAEQDFVKACALQPDSPIPLINLAGLYHRLGKFDDAAETLNKGLAVIRANGESQLRAENIQRMLNSWEENHEAMFF